MKEKKDEQVRLRFFGIPRLLPYLKPYRRMMIAMVLMGGLSSAIDAFYPLFNRYALDHFIGEQTLKGLAPFILSYLALLLGQTVINYISTYDCGKVEMYVDRDLRNTAFNHLQTLSFSYYNQNSVGYIHSRVMSDTSMIGDLVSWRMMNLIWNGAFLVGILIVMLVIDIRLTAFILLLIPVAAVLMVYFQRKLLFFNRQIREINSKITGNYNEGITGERTVKILAAEEKMIRAGDAGSDPEHHRNPVRIHRHPGEHRAADTASERKIRCGRHTGGH